MKKSKIAAGVLLLAMGLTPVNSGLSYADDMGDPQVEASTQAETSENDKTTEDTNTTDENKELEISGEKEMEKQQASDTETLADVFSMEQFIDNKVREISTTKLYLSLIHISEPTRR